MSTTTETSSTEHGSTAALDRVHTNPASNARIRERIAITTEAARRAGSFIANAPFRPIAPTRDAVEALDVFRRPLQDVPIPAREVLAELDAFGSPATVVQNHGRFFGFVNGGVEPAAAGAAILATAWDQNPGLAVTSPSAAVLDEVAAGWVLDLLGMPQGAVATFTTGATLANFTTAPVEWAVGRQPVPPCRQHDARARLRPRGPPRSDGRGQDQSPIRPPWS